MREWLEIGIHQVNALLARDADYQRLKQELEKAQVGYRTATEKLTPKELEQIEDYIALCEEIEYQKTLTAYYCEKGMAKGRQCAANPGNRPGRSVAR